MKKSIAVLSALFIGLSYCPPEIAVMAADGPKMAMDTENTGADQALSADDKNSSVDQVVSADDEDSSTVQMPSADDNGSLIERFWKKITGTGEKENLQKNPDSEIYQETQIENHKTEDALLSGIKNLQIPQKLAVVIDPWEMDGKGQVYSEPYIIRNTGDTPGILTLSNLACRPSEQSGVVVKTNKEGLHDSGDKSIYMEMVLGNENRIIFSTEKSQYQTELKPGEELAISLEGEVNENAFGEWTNQDVAISLVYSWEIKEERDDLNPGEEQTNDSDEAEVNEQEKQQQTDASEEKFEDCQQTNTSREETPDLQQTDTSIDDAEDEQKADSEEEQESINEKEPDNTNDDTQQGVSTSINPEGKKEPEIDLNMEVGQTGGNMEGTANGSWINEGTVSLEEKEKEIKSIDLHKPQKVDVNIDSWKIDEKGRIVSQQYLLCNAGDTAGIWKLSDIICKPQEQNGVRITTDKKILHDSEEKAVYMELLLGNGEKVILSQESSTYEVKLEPGEKLAVYFIGEMNGNLFESREEGDITVTAVCSWNTD